MNIISIIPARGGSKGIPRKNIYSLQGKPLICYTIEHALASPDIDRVFVSSDDERILKISKSSGAETILRPTALAGDDTPLDDVINHVLEILDAEKYQVDLIVLLQPTSPLRTGRTLKQAISQFKKNINEFDSLMPLGETSSKIGTIEKQRFQPLYRPGIQRQDLKKTYYDCGTVHIFKPDLIRTGRFFGDKIFGFPIAWPESLDIDTMDEMQLADYHLSKKSHKKS